jgi:membrane protease YdiL (CAAX protease family)
MMVTLVRRNPLPTFFILAYALTWALTPLIAISPALGIPGLLMPAVAGAIVARITGGKEGVRAVFSRLLVWRVGWVWYLVVLGLPFVLSGVMMLLGVLLGADNQIQVAPVSVLSAVIFVLVVGEELGWRGFALPRLLEKQSGLAASLTLGVLWGLWHLPTFFVSGTPQADIPLPAYLIYVVAFSVLIAWVFQHTQGSVLLSTLFHGAFNTFGLINPALDPDLRWWLFAAVYSAAALLVVLVFGKNLKRAA